MSEDAPAGDVVAPVVTKSVTVAKLLRRKQGATIAELVAATGWQPHSVRAYLSGLRKKGGVLEKEKRKSGATSYRLVQQ